MWVDERIAVTMAGGKQVMTLYTFANGDKLTRRGQALIISFNGRRDVLSTAAINGGLQKDLKWVFNHDCKIGGQKDAPIKAPTYAGHMAVIAGMLGLDPAYASGLSTAADMVNVAIESQTHEDLTVTAAVTGGIDVNGGRVGDPAGWHEVDGVSLPVGGTINILLHIDAHLTEGALTRALVTCTEAKTAALQELLAPSLFSSGIATGSGTDGTIIITNPDAYPMLTYAGKHSKLGELIGRTVMSAVKKALYLQTGIGSEQQFDIFCRIGRYGITREKLLRESPGIDQKKLRALSTLSTMVTLTSLYVHLLDQLSWALLSPSDVKPAAKTLLHAMGMTGCALPSGKDTESFCQQMLDSYCHGLKELCSD